MSALIKLSSLTDAEKLSFTRLDGKKGRYVLAKKMQTRDWDTGSVWQLVKGAEGLCIARCDDKPSDKNTVSSGICVNKCTCGSMLKSASLGSHKVDYCPKCQPDFNAGLSKTASLNTPPEITEKVGTGISVGLTVTADYLNSKILPVATKWIQDGWDDFTAEGVQKRVITAVKANELTSTDAEMFQDQAERVAAWSSQFAMSSQDEGLFTHAGQSDTTPEFTKSMSKFAAMKPEGMSWDKFISCYKTLTAGMESDVNDKVKCSNCDFEGVVAIGSDTCPACGEIGCLQGVPSFSDYETTEPVTKNVKRTLTAGMESDVNDRGLRRKASWGERAPRKINIYIDGDYVCSTMRSRTLAEAIEVFKAKPVVQGLREDGTLGPVYYDVTKGDIRAKFAKESSKKVIALHDDGLVTITISLANAAFGDNAGPECARILRKLADQFDYEGGVGDVSLRDINGNRCGQVSVTGGAGDFAIPDDADEGESRLGRESHKVSGKVK